MKRQRLFVPLYLSVALAVFLGGSFVNIFYAYAATDFASIATFIRDNRDFIASLGNGAGHDDLALEEAIEERFQQEMAPQFDPRHRRFRFPHQIVLYWAVIALWLLPVYRHKPGELVSPRTESRVVNLPWLILLFPWLLGIIDLLYDAAGGGWSIRIASVLIFGALVGQFNINLTSTYITRHLADRVFQGPDRFRAKKGRAVTITQRVAIVLTSLALLPLILNVAIPVIFNWWLIDEVLSTTQPDFLRIAQIVAPVAVMVLANTYFIVAQLVAIGSFRHAIQKPIDTLIERMNAVARGDFSTRSSVLSGDEIGVLKSHFNTMVEGLEEREKIRDTFGRYVSMEIAEKLMKTGTVDFAGEEIVTTVMFADIRSFTAFSERHQPRIVVEFLNDYFSHMIEPISANRGVINKFIGDSIMAVFSPVFGVEDHAEASIRAALGMREALVRFNDAGRYEPIRQGVGIHTGVLVAGTVGTDARREYTVIGDTVNVASRIESQTKVFETDILVSCETVALLRGASGESFALAPTDPVTMRGKSAPMVLYTAG